MKLALLLLLTYHQLRDSIAHYNEVYNYYAYCTTDAARAKAAWKKLAYYDAKLDSASCDSIKRKLKIR